MSYILDRVRTFVTIHAHIIKLFAASEIIMFVNTFLQCHTLSTFFGWMGLFFFITLVVTSCTQYTGKDLIATLFIFLFLLYCIALYCIVFLSFCNFTYKIQNYNDEMEFYTSFLSIHIPHFVLFKCATPFTFILSWFLFLPVLLLSLSRFVSLFFFSLLLTSSLSPLPLTPLSLCVPPLPSFPPLSFHFPS